MACSKIAVLTEYLEQTKKNIQKYVSSNSLVLLNFKDLKIQLEGPDKHKCILVFCVELILKNNRMYLTMPIQLVIGFVTHIRTP